MHPSKFHINCIYKSFLFMCIFYNLFMLNYVIEAKNDNNNYEIIDEIFNKLAKLFDIPTDKPDTVITADRFDINEGSSVLSGNVKITRECEELTASKVICYNKIEVFIATGAPRIVRKESLEDKKVSREFTLDAQTILWDKAKSELYASNSVVFKIEEKSWDLATYTCINISSDELKGYKELEEVYFVGNVKINDQKRFGSGNELEYYKKNSTIILSGNAIVETEEWDNNKKQFVKKVIKGQKIHYNIDTKFVKVE